MKEQPVNDFNTLLDFIRQNPEDYEEKLKLPPYCCSISNIPYNENWRMFKYSQFESDFSNPVVRCCRGSIVELGKNMRYVCAPFYKFANYGENGEDVIDWKSARVELKVDGGLKKLCKVDGKFYWYTNKGLIENEIMNSIPSVDEPCSREAKTYLGLVNVAMDTEANGTDRGWMDKIPDNSTLMFELVSPRDKIIVQYDRTQMFFLGARDNVTLKEYDRDSFAEKHGIPFDRPPVLPAKDMDAVQAMLSTWNGEKEGVVIVDKDFRRIKIKSEAYRKLKFVKGEGNFSEKAIFHYIMDGSIDDAEAAYPEIIPSVEKIESNIKDWKSKCLAVVKEGTDKYSTLEGSNGEKRKALALWAGKRKDFSLIMMSLNPLKLTKYLSSFKYDEYRRIYNGKE